MSQILILDFGSMYKYDIIDRLNELNIDNTLVDCNISLEELNKYKDVKGLIFSGSPDHVYEEEGRRCRKEIIESGLPILGICYGHQVIHEVMGGKTAASKTPENGDTEIIMNDCLLFKGLDTITIFRMAHGDEVTMLADGYRCIAHTKDCRYAGSMHEVKPIYTVQFHPEADKKEETYILFSNFVYDICHLEK